MIFRGRMLANQEGITIWQRHQGEGYHLHFVNRGVVVDLSAAELAELAALAAGATRALGVADTIEDPKDHRRRLQILQARVNDYIKRERATDSKE